MSKVFYNERIFSRFNVGDCVVARESNEYGTVIRVIRYGMMVLGYVVQFCDGEKKQVGINDLVEGVVDE